MADYNTLRGDYPLYEYDSFIPGENNVFPDNRIMDFLTVGPFVLKTDGSFESEHMYEREKILLEDYLLPDGGEKNIAPVLSQKVKNNYYGAEYLSWKKGFIKWDALRFDDSEESACDPALFATEQRNAVYYAAFYIKCNKEEKCVICYNNSGSTLFINGEQVDFRPYGCVKGLWTLGYQCPVTLKKGNNLVLFKVRPGYIADTMDLSMSNCSVFPVITHDRGLYLTSPTVTRAYSGTDGNVNQIFPVFAAAFEDTASAVISYGDKTENIPPMKKGEVRVIRLHIPAGNKNEDRKISVGLNGIKADYYFPVSPYEGYKGREFVDTGFHFDTTYHQEQRTYALGAFHITKGFAEKLAKNPGFKATLSELDYLHPFYTLYPQYRDIIKRGFEEGRCEADCFYNQPNDLTSSGEAFIRNLIYGQLYHRDVMGRISTVYAPGDVFGHFSQLTQVCAKGGCDYIKWGKMMLGVDSLFRHVSPDGTSLIHDKGIGRTGAMRFGVNACDCSAGALSYMEAVPRDDDTSWMKDTVTGLSFGVSSDSADIINNDARLALKEGRNKIGYTSRDITQHHSGVLLTRTDFKQANRLCENLLITAEKFSAIAFMYGAEYPDKAIDKAERQLLTAQHHDSITGTNNEISFIDLMIEYREAASILTDIIEKACRFIASGVKAPDRENSVFVFNPLPWDRGGKCVFRLPRNFSCENGAVLTDIKGKEYPAITGDGYGWFIASALPPMGYTVMRIKKASAPVVITGNEETIENSKFRLTVDKSKGGAIVSLYDKKEKREVIDKNAPSPANTVYVLKEIHNRMETQHELYTTGHKLLSSDYDAEVISEKSSLYQKLKIKVKLDTVAVLRQEITLYKNSDTVDFITAVEDYQGEDDLFTVAFPVDIKGAAVIYDDRLSPHVSTRSKKYMSFQTHQYASFSGCRVLPAGKWFGAGPSLTLKMKDRRINFGMTAIIRKEELKDISERILFALSKKCIPVTPYPDCEQHGGNKIIHFNEDVYETDTRVVLSIKGDGNLYAEKLMQGIKKSAEAKILKALDKNGTALIYFKDSDNIYHKDIDVILALGADKKALSAFASDLEKKTASGYIIDEDVIFADEPGCADDYGCEILNKGTVSSSVEGKCTLNMMLFHTAAFYGNAGKVTGGSELVPEQKTHIFSYALYPHKGSFREAQVYRKAEEFGNPALCFSDTRSSGNEILSEEKGFIKTPQGFCLTAFKAAGYPYANLRSVPLNSFDRGFALRGVETDGVFSKINIKTGFEVFGAVSTDLLEENPTALKAGKNSVTLTAGANSIETIVIKAPKAGKIGSVSLDAGTEQVKKIYVRSWEHDMGSTCMGNLGFAATIEKLPRTYKNKETLYINAVNNFYDRNITADIKISSSEGINASVSTVKADIKAGGYKKIPVEISLSSPDTEGQVKISYGYDGMEFYDVCEFGYFNPEVKLEIRDNKLICTVENTSAQYLSGGLYIASPFETWGNVLSPGEALGNITPEAISVELSPFETKNYEFDVSLKDDMMCSYWAAVKLAVNGRIHFAFARKKGPRHNIWAHEFYSEIAKDNGSIKKILEM